MNDIITILLADDHVLLRNGLKLLINQEPDMDVIGGSNNGKEAINLVQELKPDIILMDISMPIMNGLEATKLILKNDKNTKVIILTMHESDEYIFEIFESGALGCLIKRTAHEHIMTAIRSVYKGNVFISPSVSRGVINNFVANPENKQFFNKKILSKRELEVVKLIAEGKSTNQISKQLHISEKTIDSHRTHIFKKLDIHNAVELTRYAIKNRIVDFE